MLDFHIIIADSGVTGSGPQVSDAGRYGFQDWTPLLDVEHILYGQRITPLPSAVQDKVSVNLHTGAVSPAVGVRALLLAFKEAGHPVRITVWDTGVARTPFVDGRWSEFGADNVRRFWVDRDPVDIGTERTEQQQDAFRQLGYGLAEMLEAPVGPQDWRVVAECVPGGTTTANVLLNVLTGRNWDTPSSSVDPKVLRAKGRLVRDLTERARDRPIRVMRRFADPFQVVLASALDAYRDPEAGNPVLLAGGCQMVAPAVAAAEFAPYVARRLHRCFITGTAWDVLQRFGGRDRALDQGPIAVESAPVVPWGDSRHPGWRLYGEGYAKEGCGLGGLLWLYDKLGMRESRGDPLSVLDAALDPKAVPPTPLRPFREAGEAFR